MFEQDPICTDDYGQLMYRCRYTSSIVSSDSVVAIGSRIPGLHSRHYMAGTDEARRLYKAEGIAFHDAEANCNTCRNFDRVKHPRNTAGFLFGICRGSEGAPDESPYADRAQNGVMIIHPDDPMHMPCYESRWDDN